MELSPAQIKRWRKQRVRNWARRKAQRMGLYRKDWVSGTLDRMNGKGPPHGFGKCDPLW